MHEETEMYAQIEAMFNQARSYFGEAVKAFWMNEAPGCPGCGLEIDWMEDEGGKMLSLNAFMYRERGVLIGYGLCSRCGGKVMAAGRLNPFRQIPLHKNIERNLIAAYKVYLHRLDA